MSNSVKCLIDYWKEVMSIECGEDETLLFRGHPNCNYILSPSAFRDEKKDSENRAYREIMIEYPNEFSRDHLSNLAKMQHYGIRTRLLDFSTDPLMSLYFASEADKSNDGQVIVCKVKRDEILHHTSDKAMMLACLPCFNDETQKKIRQYCISHPEKASDNSLNEAMERFLHEIRRECPAFECAIVGKDLLNNYFVRTYKDSERLRIQSGLFVIFGLGDRDMEDDNRIERRINISRDHKNNILKELRLINISNSTVYPDFERRAMQIAHRRVDWIDIDS